MPVASVGLVVGPHLPSAEVWPEYLRRPRAAGARIFQFMTRQEKRGQPSPAPPEAEILRELRTHWETLGYLPPVAHAPRSLNLATSERARREAALEALRRDCFVAREVGARTVVVHPGSAPCPDLDGAPAALGESLRWAVEHFPDLRFAVELRFGISGDFGRTLEDLARAFERVRTGRERLGVCLDTAHAYWAGDLVPEHADRLADRISRLFGPGSLRLCHLNDAEFPRRSRRHRHRVPGWGQVSVFGFFDLFASRLLDGVPLIVEAGKPEVWPDVAREVLRMAERAEAVR